MGTKRSDRQQILLLDDRVPALNDFDVVRVIKTAGNGTIGSQPAKAAKTSISASARAVWRMRRASPARRTQLGEQAPLDLNHLFLRVQHFSLMLFQLCVVNRSAFTRSVCVEIRWGEVHIGLRNFQVVAEDAVELDLQRTDAGALALAVFDLGNILCCCAQVAQFVQCRVGPSANYSAIVQRNGRLVRQRGRRFARASRLVRRTGRAVLAASRQESVPVWHEPAEA